MYIVLCILRNAHTYTRSIQQIINKYVYITEINLLVLLDNCLKMDRQEVFTFEHTKAVSEEELSKPRKIKIPLRKNVHPYPNRDEH